MITRGRFRAHPLTGPIQSVEATYYVHATEDPAKFAPVMEALLGRGAEPEREEMEGHYGNRILRVRYHLVGEEANSAFSSLVNGMDAAAKKELMGALEQAVDEHGALYVRLDKQLLLSGKAAMGRGDSVRIRVKPRLFMMKEGAGMFFRKAFGGTR